VIGYAVVIAALILAYRTWNPPASTLMLWQRLNGVAIDHTWMPLSRISPNLVRAVIASEDTQFCRHRGVDWRELEVAYERAQDGIPRGGSTISMQLTKNLFLWPSKSYIRKALEIPITLATELVWTKRRLLEVYLNIAEWGPGVFGAEAAAQYHFSKPASALTEGEAALLAVALPNPIARDAGEPDPRLRRRAATIQARARGADSFVRCLAIYRPTPKS
jgi:monofunctional glycosyltransferase